MLCKLILKVCIYRQTQVVCSDGSLNNTYVRMENCYSLLNYTKTHKISNNVINNWGCTIKYLL